MRNPPRSCDLHGGFFAPFGEPKPLPLGEVAPKVTERASPARKSRGRSDGQALCQSDAIAVSGIRRQRPSPLSLTSFASSPKGGAIGMSVSFRLDAESPTGRKRAGLAAKASGFWTTHLVKLSLAQTAEHYRFRDIVLCSSSGKLSGLPRPLPLGEVALRSNDGEGYREFVENARQKREEFVKVIKMRRRY